MAEPGDCALDISAGKLADGGRESESRDEKVTTDAIIAALRSVYDPEIPVNVYDLGLIYRIEIGVERAVEIDMTLTAPACPVAGEIMNWVRNAVEGVDGIGVVKINLVFDPPWDQSKMSDEAKLELGFM